ncbi:MAG TPA: protein kinase [Bryobacteraceae bacterium]|nr:protein kinase [Bryobacteraceae bacterium]
MNPERWRQVEEVYQAALERELSQRSAFLADACQNDEALRREAESLLAQGGSFLEHPAWVVSELKPGSRLGRYEILAAIGAGGMGKVYRARDTSLNREVAIKVSSERFSNRFEREARAVAALNHPNICTLHDVGPDFLVMELVEGPTLADRIKEGPMPADEALRIARQIADALEAAHENGVVHRDLKPANIKIKLDGTVKLLDFGLAWQKSDREAERATTATMTAPGTILGTAPYMSPEQARGKPVDKRADVWAFGAVLYEMLAGQRAFKGETATDVLASVVNTEPDWNKIPDKMQRLLRRCLEKDPERRLRHVGDFALLLEEASPAQPPKRRLPWAAIAVAVAMVAAGASWALWRAHRRSPDTAASPTVKFTFTPAQLSRGSNVNSDAAVFLSGDARHIAYVESPSGQLWIRDLDQEQARPLPGATGVYEAFWSPDDQSIGYSTGPACDPGGQRTGGNDCSLVRISAQGGTPVLITKLQGGFRRASWSSDGATIVYCEDTGMYTVPARGGSPTRVIEDPPFLDPSGSPHIEHPSFLDLPDGRRAILFQAVDAPQRGHGIYVQLMGENRGRLVTVSSSSNPYPAYSPTGHIVYADGNYDSAAIWALPFSLATLQPRGKAFPIAQHGSSPRVSRTGTLVYSDVPSNHLQLLWCDRSGKTISAIGEPIRQESLALSPDGHKLAVQGRENEIDMWLYDVDRGIKTRFTFDSAVHSLSAWTPSGDEITYAATRNGNFDIFSKPSNGNGEARLLVSTPLDERAPDWSPDRRFLIYMAGSRETKNQLLYRERRQDGSLGEPRVFLKTPFNDADPRFSPDGRFVVYVSDESGKNEIYVRDFPNGANKWLISANGGTAPRWRRDGKEIFYIEQGKLMAVNVITRPTFSPGVPALLFENRFLQIGYDVSADGNRFVVLERPAGEPPLSIHVVHNWFEEFRRRLQE